MFVRIFIADPGLRGFVGHHFTYSQAVATAAIDRRMSATILAHRQFIGQDTDGAVTCQPVFTAQFQTSGGSGLLRRAVFATAARMPARLAAPIAPVLRTARRRWRNVRKSDDGFGAELCTALSGLGCSADDMVLLHSASAANLGSLLGNAGQTEQIGALAVVLRRTPAEMDSDDPAPEPVAAVLNGLASQFGARLRLFADTDDLAMLYRSVVALPIGTVPPPVIVPPIRQMPIGEPPHLVFAGGARLEKGYTLLPALARTLAARARLSIHSGMVDASADPLVQRAHASLRATQGPQLRLIEHALSPHEYVNLIAAADLLLLPYDSDAYGPRSSGILAEARALGVPSVVPGNCWMAHVTGPSDAVVFQNSDDFAPAVERALLALPALTDGARAAAPAWRVAHSPATLLDRLMTPPTDTIAGDRIRSRHCDAAEPL